MATPFSTPGIETALALASVNSDQAPETPTPNSHFTSLFPGLNCNHKHPADLTQYAQNLSRNLHLKTENQAELHQRLQFAGVGQYQVWLAARTLNIEQKLDSVHPPNTPATISLDLNAKIDDLAVKIFLDPAIPAYVQDAAKCGPKDTLMIGESLGTFDILTNCFTGPFTGVVELSRNVIAEAGGKSCSVDVSIPIVASIAFLWSVYVKEAQATATGKPGANFWNAVDTQLERIRSEKKNDIRKISRVFARILDKDQENYDTDKAKNLEGIATESGITLDDSE
ncbi:hypothetical protein GYMLUDRAFT_63259 [Collybiopsis luxurians FD-317 M1]|uniref:Uncharacterized protein n=1 Tax=Collybiopsis luxurians FD-317 M1 TaxID=944289 RepID=A0A0D0BHQ6_9AGAR|nr:hypothetical protein GYMLUDRAFT_63259 [Collybiopsis luxurians FD-317 M1]